MQWTSFVALAVAGVVIPAFAMVAIASALGSHIAQEVTLAAAVTLGVVTLGGPPRPLPRH
jgi:hypothetical protein